MGGSLSLKLAVRREGMERPVTVRLKDLPPGVTAREVVLPAAKCEATLLVVADCAAKEGESVAKAVITVGKAQMERDVTVVVRARK